MAKFRVYEIAKKYNKDNKEILEILKANHVEVKNHMSTIGDEQIKMIENALKPKKEAKQDHNSFSIIPHKFFRIQLYPESL